ncbi:MAG: hypothetical protein LC107_12325 [Chitinophagales bacterium]|nr:hypothetical protein [Chitinophagales bacterium]
MAKYILEGAGSINWMAIFALVTFFFVFTMSVVLVFRKNKKDLDRLKNLPLEDDE